MNCHYCHGVDTVEATTTRFCACGGPAPFVVENVPASVCSQCGDKAFSATVVETFEKIRNGEFQANDSWSVKVFDMEKLRQPLEAKPEPANVFIPFVRPSSGLVTPLHRKLPTISSRVVPRDLIALLDPEGSSAWSPRSLNLKLNPAPGRIMIVPNPGS